LHPIRELLAGAKRVVALTGAGISAESGIPTFRGSGALWKQYRAEDLATPEAFARDPKLVWEWYDWRRGRIAAAEPNSGHKALVELEEKVADFTLITQNVDGLHQRAGSRRILPLHGDIWTLSCTACGRRERDMRATLPDLPPCCACGGLLRPGVVWFGEPLPSEIWEEAQAATRRAEVLLVIGTSAVVYPAASLVPLAKSSGAKVVEINTDETPMSAAIDYVCRGPAGETLPQLLA
jgi:NAD-dependent deacetylase